METEVPQCPLSVDTVQVCHQLAAFLVGDAFQLADCVAQDGYQLRGYGSRLFPQIFQQMLLGVHRILGNDSLLGSIKSCSVLVHLAECVDEILAIEAGFLHLIRSHVHSVHADTADIVAVLVTHIFQHYSTID